MTVLTRVVGSALGALATLLILLMALAMASWIGGWSITLPYLVSVARAPGDITEGVLIEPNGVALAVAAGLLSTLFAAVDRPRRTEATARH